MDTVSAKSASSKGSIKSDSKSSKNNIQGNNSNDNSQTSEKCLEEDCNQYAGAGTAITLGLTQSCASNDYVVRLEKDFNILQETFLDLSTQLIRIQVRVRQITVARPTELRLLLEDLEIAAFQSLNEYIDGEELPNLMIDVVSMGSIQEKQQRLIVDLHNKFHVEDFDHIQTEKYNPNDPRGSLSKNNNNDDDQGNDNSNGNGGGNGNENNENNENTENKTYKMRSKKPKASKRSQTDGELELQPSRSSIVAYQLEHGVHDPPNVQERIKNKRRSSQSK